MSFTITEEVKRPTTTSSTYGTISQDEEIAKNSQRITELFREQLETNKLLTTLAASNAELQERVDEIKESNDNLEAKIRDVKKEVRSSNPTTRNVFLVVGGIVIVGLISMGIVYGVLRSH